MVGGSLTRSRQKVPSTVPTKLTPWSAPAHLVFEVVRRGMQVRDLWRGTVRPPTGARLVVRSPQASRRTREAAATPGRRTGAVGQPGDASCRLSIRRSRPPSRSCATDVIPISARVRSTSRRRISIVAATPSCPPAAKP